MNVVNEIQRINERELKQGLIGNASWHSKYKDSAWIFLGNISFELTEGDVLCVMSQWGEIEDINLIRDEDTGKSKGFAFIKYEDQRSTILAVDNMNGVTLLERVIRVDHVEKYRLPKSLQEKEEKAKSEEKKDVSEVTKWEPGHAYKGKDLVGNNTITNGVDIWAKSSPQAKEMNESSSNSEKDGEEKPRQKEKKKKEKKKREKRKKEHDKKHRKRIRDDADKSKTKSKASRSRSSSPEKEHFFSEMKAEMPAHVEGTGRPSLRGAGIADWRGVTSSGRGIMPGSFSSVQYSSRNIDREVRERGTGDVKDDDRAPRRGLGSGLGGMNRKR